MSAPRTWIKNPQAIFTANDQDARGGLVIEGALIVELLAAARQLGPEGGLARSRCADDGNDLSGRDAQIDGAKWRPAGVGDGELVRCHSVGPFGTTGSAGDLS